MNQLIQKIDTLLSRYPKLGQFLRFCIIGTLAACVHYGIYYALQYFEVNLNVAYTTGYIISFIGNYIATNYFTFRTLPSWKNFLGFSGSHVINYFLHMLLFNFFLFLGVHKLIAPPLVMLVAMLVQFTILRFVFKKSKPK